MSKKNVKKKSLKNEGNSTGLKRNTGQEVTIKSRLIDVFTSTGCLCENQWTGQLRRTCTLLLNPSIDFDVPDLLDMPVDVKRRTGRLINGVLAIDHGLLRKRHFDILSQLSNQILWSIMDLSFEFIPFNPDATLSQPIAVINVWGVYGFPSIFDLEQSLSLS